jgi:hypothetical protein
MIFGGALAYDVLPDRSAYRPFAEVVYSEIAIILSFEFHLHPMLKALRSTATGRLRRPAFSAVEEMHR